MKGRVAFAMLVVLVGAGSAHARSAEIKPWVQLFTQYSYNISDYAKDDPRYGDIDHNAFEITRAWFGLDARLSGRWSTRVIVGAVRAQEPQTATVPTGRADDPDTPEDESQAQAVTDFGPERTGPYEMLLYKAFARYRLYQYMQFDLGVISDAYSSVISRFWHHRYVLEYPLFSHRLSRSIYGDLGLAMWGEVPGGFGGYRFEVVNGEGIRNAEDAAGKAFEARVHLYPFRLSRWLEGLGGMGMYRYDKVEADAPETLETLWEALASYELDLRNGFGFSLAAEMVSRDIASDDPTVVEATSTVQSAWADVTLWNDYGLLARADLFDPDTDNDSDTGKGYRDEETSVLAGVWWQPTVFARFCVNLRQTAYTAKRTDSNGRTVDTDPDRWVYLNTEFDF